MKNLKWRLSKLPTVSELTELVKDKIITNEEARFCLFTSETEEDRDKESLKTEIKFLREMVDKLSNRSQIVEIIKEIKIPYYQYPWYSPYQTWCNQSSGGVTVGLAGNNAFTTQSTSTGALSQTNSFKNIQTF